MEGDVSYVQEATAAALGTHGPEATLSPASAPVVRLRVLLNIGESNEQTEKPKYQRQEKNVYLPPAT